MSVTEALQGSRSWLFVRCSGQRWSRHRFFSRSLTLHSSLTRQTELEEIISDAFFVVDAAWCFTFVNDAAAERWERDAASLIGRNMWTEFPRMVGSVFEPVYRRVAAEQKPIACSAFFDATQSWYELRIFPMNGGIAASFRDTTEERSIEKELSRLSAESERQKRLFETMLSSTADFNYVFDLQGRFTYVNNALLALWQITLPEALGKTFFQLDYPIEFAQRLQEEIQQVIHARASLRGETRYTSAPGTRAYEYILNPVFDANGKVEAVAGSTRDITDRKEAEIAMREEAQRKDEFIATLAHELRNPLAPMRNALEVNRMAKGDERMAEYAQNILDRQLTHMVHLIDDLLDLSRLTTGKVVLRKRIVDLTSVIENAIEIARPHIEAAVHDFQVNIPAETFCVDVDATRMTQAIANLLTNAAKFTARGGKISLSVRQENSEVVVTVNDNGIGLDGNALSRVFDMFTQVDGSLERAQGGLGIGLSLVKGIVQLHGGTVEARSAGEGLGSDFIVRLALAGDGHSPVNAKNRPTSHDGKTTHRILVADDNVDSGGSLVVMLNLLGHHAIAVANGLDALKVGDSFQPDVCLLDIGMPGMNGYDVAMRMRDTSWGKDALILALTGWGQDEDKRRSANAGIDMHLVKPVDPKALQSILDGSVPLETSPSSNQPATH